VARVFLAGGVFKCFSYLMIHGVENMIEDAVLKTAVAAAVKAALVPVNAELARVSEQLALVVSDNAELKERVEMLEEDIFCLRI
jgi:hypothetical protein